MTCGTVTRRSFLAAGASLDAQWIAGANKHYSGPIVLGRDLMEIP